MFAVRALTPRLVSVLFDVLKAGNWAMIPALDDAYTITCSPEHLTNLPAEIPEVIVCRSSKELGVLLMDGYEAWQRYKNSVV
jgi:hypothetical protein